MTHSVSQLIRQPHADSVFELVTKPLCAHFAEKMDVSITILEEFFGYLTQVDIHRYDNNLMFHIALKPGQTRGRYVP